MKALQILNQRQINKTSDFIFTFNGKVLTLDYITRKFKSYFMKAGLNPKLTFHCLRSTFASWLLQRGVSITNISKLLGHSSVKVTEANYAFLRSAGLIDSVNFLNN